MNGMPQNLYDLKITAFPRIHITLIGMNSDGYRINGGIGFSVCDPKIYIKIKTSKDCEIFDERFKGFLKEERERIVNKLNQIKFEFGFKNSIECTIDGDSMTHFGLGTSTAVYLGCIEGLFLLNNRKYDELLLKHISSRGGTSGIGLITYFKGGCVFDVGISNTSDSILKPSSIIGERGNLPLIMNHINAPKWGIGILLPLKIKNKSEKEEEYFFKKTCPISKENVNSILYEVVYGALSNLLEENYIEFSASVNAIQKTKWKLEERQLYSPEISNIESILMKSGAIGIGMSSLGPGLYFMSKNFDTMESIKENRDFRTFFTEMNNESRIVEYA
jgi:beta-ribofuranosylaminobenzene 5'-phosphate synthase